MQKLARALAQGYVYQGEPSLSRDGERRGEPSGHLPPTAFVNFLQNHDQIGNRALGERISALADPERLKAFQAILLLAPHTPMLFMGDEWGASTPFQYFCDFHGPLADAVREGRRREFAAFFANHPEAGVPDPLAEETFAASRLDWGEVDREPHAAWLAATRRLLELRHRAIVPRTREGKTYAAGADLVGEHGLVASWCLGDNSRLTLVANLADEPWTLDMPPNGGLLHASAEVGTAEDGCPTLPAGSVAWYLAEAGR
jgi:1,4-alpha-glucan branching enzyme